MHSAPSRGTSPPSTSTPTTPGDAASRGGSSTGCWARAFSLRWRECKFAKPIFIGDTLTVKGTVVSVSEIGSEAEIKAVITNQDGKRVTRGIIKAGLAK